MNKNVYFFVPNIIGYVRIILAVVSFYFMQSDYKLASFCYVLSVALDELDGYTARLFKQSTQFGAMLDQLTDRAGSMGLMFALSHLYPGYMFYFQSITVVDIVSHWLHTHCCSMMQSSSHKDVGADRNLLLYIYYTNALFLSIMVYGTEMFYIMIYLLKFTKGPIVLTALGNFAIFELMMILCAPVAALKFCINIIQLFEACQRITSIDNAAIIGRETGDKSKGL